ncbi:ribbon-helix-helix domain-containing protein [Carboxydichorda subterranea]|uniref:ribbon-helix-helix domain-containing protein n=1 Tax=Carboxydichorda subterranea TaxID=3109565 RepID=UPI0038573E5C
MLAAVGDMKRTQVYLDPLEHEALKRRAAEEGVSMSQLLRRLVRQQLGLRGATRAGADRLMRLVGIGASGWPDVSERHDDHLAEALGREVEEET